MTKYILRDASRLNKHFYKGLDENFLLSKALTLYKIADCHEKFLSEQKGDEDFEGIDPKKYREALLAEIHFSEILQFEAVFALLIAIYQDLPHWLFLTTYKTAEIKSWVADYMAGNFAGISNGKAASAEEFFDLSLYANYVGNKDEKDYPWSKNIENIDWLLRRMGEKYLNSSEFNAYKHGLRVHTGETAIRIQPNDDPDHPGFGWRSENSLVFLELKDIGEGGLTVHLTTKHFNPLEALNHLHIMRIMASCIKRTRLARLNGESGVEINTFFEINQKQFQELSSKVTKWSITW